MNLRYPKLIFTIGPWAMFRAYLHSRQRKKSRSVWTCSLLDNPSWVTKNFGKVILDDRDFLPSLYYPALEKPTQVGTERSRRMFEERISVVSQIEDDTERLVAWDAALMNYHEHGALLISKVDSNYPSEVIRMTKEEMDVLKAEGVIPGLPIWKEKDRASGDFIVQVKARLAELRPHRSVTEKKQLNEALPQASTPIKGGKRL